MELRKYIKTAIVDIIGGVADAQKEIEQGEVVPTVRNHFDSIKYGIADIQTIDFEISVKIDEMKGSEAKLGVVSAIIGAGVAGKSSSESFQTNTLKFRVPIRLPKAESEKSKSEY